MSSNTPAAIFVMGVLGSLVIWYIASIFPPQTVSPLTSSYAMAQQYYHALYEGQFPPRFMSNDNNGYGSLLFIEQYPLRLWVNLPFIAVGVGELASGLLISLLIAAISLRGMQKLLINGECMRLMSLGFSLLCAWLSLSDNILGITLCFLPWMGWFMHRVIEKSKLKFSTRTLLLDKESIIFIIFTALWLLSSSQALFLSIGLIAGFTTVTKKINTQLLFMLGISLSLVAWHWLPAIIESKKDSINEPNIVAAKNIFDDYPNQNVISPNAAVKIIPDQRARHTNSFTVIVPEKSLLIQKTMYFPGWRVKANDQPVTLENPADHAGLVAYQLEAGTHLVTSQMTQLTIPRIVGNSLSIVSVAIWVWCMQKAKRPGMTNVQRLFRISLSSKERLAKIMRKFWRRQNQ